MSIDSAIEELVKVVKLNISVQDMELENAAGMICAEDIYSPIDLPPFDRSAVDGYALYSEATSSASSNNPIPFKLVNYGSVLPSHNNAVPISTGQRIPEGADAVVMVEDVIREGDIIYVMKPIPKYGNVSRKGEDIRKGELLVAKGTIIKPQHLAALSAIGMTHVKVYRRLNIGLISTGSEVVSPLQGLKAYEQGFILDSTSILIFAVLSAYKFMNVNWYGFVKDDEHEIKAMTEKALNENDILIFTGGTGPGESDKTFKSIVEMNRDIRIIARGLAIRPGRPTSIIIVENKPIFLLSGFPVAAYIALYEVVLRALYTLLKIRNELFIEVPARIVKRVYGSAGYDNYLRAKLFKCNEDLCVEPIMLRGSGILKSLLEANALIVIPRNVEGFEKGEKIWIKIL
jgi:molybdopterin molybdotransferase|uniref:Molybdopterin molybdenumtransferase MoeA n=1 Tax=Ignisphaera aggregans TaxID=334771 RepID=A0A7J2U2Z0_9CREN